MKTKTEIKQLLSQYFKGVDADIDVILVGRTAFLDIQYVDFKPTDIVRSQLEAIIPNTEWTRLERTYSEAAIKAELWRLYMTDTPMLIADSNGLIHSTIFPIYIQERMETEQFTH